MDELLVENFHADQTSISFTTTEAEGSRKPSLIPQ